MNGPFDRAIARIIKETDPTEWDGADVETVVYTARALQLDRRKLCRRLGLATNAPWSEIIVRLEKYLPCRECHQPGRRHKLSCVTGARQWAEENYE